MSTIRLPNTSRSTEFVIIVLIVIVLVSFVWKASQLIETGSYHPHCANSLKQIGLALHNYHEANGCFPPPYIADQNGTPMHSWRVLLLPYLDEHELFAKYDFKEPWNGPHNSKLANQMPVWFGCPDQKVRLPGTRQWTTSTTNYLALVGPRAAFQAGRPRKRSEFKDDPGFTLMVVEVTDPEVNWMEPRDIDVSKGPVSLTGAVHKRDNGLWSTVTGTYVMYADGSVRLLPSTTPANMIRGLITIDGGEPHPKNR